MKIEIVSMNEETGEVELDLDEEGQNYLIQLGVERLVLMSLDEEAPNEKL